MLRRLLACLALLTGLTAAGVPAQAEVAVAMASRLEASASRDLSPRGQVQIADLQVEPGAEFADFATAQPWSAPAWRPSPVQLGSDRARE